MHIHLAHRHGRHAVGTRHGHAWGRERLRLTIRNNIMCIYACICVYLHICIMYIYIYRERERHIDTYSTITVDEPYYHRYDSLYTLVMRLLNVYAMPLNGRAWVSRHGVARHGVSWHGV